MKQIYRIASLMLLITFAFAASAARQAVAPREDGKSRPEVRKVLVIGDSMTGWLAERLNAYAKENGFTVSTVVWDGSTIRKWADSPRLSKIISDQAPDAIFVSLGMNELFEANPATRLKGSVDKLKKAAGDTPLIWIGPPSWPGHNKGETLNTWLASEMGEGHFFRSFDLELPRQSARNPHPSREGMIKWMDAVMKWLEKDGAVELPGYAVPTKEKMSRPASFTYKRMKETL